MDYKVTFSDIEIVDNTIYASANEFNALIKINIDTNETEFIGSCSGREIIYTKQHRMIKRYRDDLLLLPYYAETGVIDIYNIKTKLCRGQQFMIPQEIKDKTKFVEYVIISNKLGIFPRDSKIPGMIMDITTGDVMEIKGWMKIAQEIGPKNSDFFMCYVILKGKVILPIKEQPYFLVVDMEQKECVLKSEEALSQKQLMCQHPDGDFYFTTKDSSDLQSWSADGGKKVIFKGTAELMIIGKGSAAYCNMISTPESIILIPTQGKEVILVNAKTRALEVLNWIGDNSRFEALDFICANHYFIGTVLYVFTLHKDYTLEIDLKKKNVSISSFQSRIINVNTNSLDQLLNQYLLEGRINIEESTPLLSMERYIDLIERMPAIDSIREYHCVGQDIYKATIELIE